MRLFSQGGNVKMIHDRGMVLQLQNFSVHDGNGVRTVIFLPGCPLRCKWCANPETWTPHSKIAVNQKKCVSCGCCHAACPKGINPSLPGNLDSACDFCGRCVEACGQNALEILCSPKTVHNVVQVIKRQEIFYRYSDGGVTFSGGEPTVQIGFMRAIAERLDTLGIDMCIETCGHFVWECVQDVFAKFSHVFFDIKCMDNALHKQLTGIGNELILKNSICVHRTGVPMTVRIPCVKNVNLTEENLAATAEFMHKYLPNANVELLPYHCLYQEKYIRLGLGEHLNIYPVPEDGDMRMAAEIFQRIGVSVVSFN